MMWPKYRKDAYCLEKKIMEKYDVGHGAQKQRRRALQAVKPSREAAQQGLKKRKGGTIQEGRTPDP